MSECSYCVSGTHKGCFPSANIIVDFISTTSFNNAMQLPMYLCRPRDALEYDRIVAETLVGLKLTEAVATIRCLFCQTVIALVMMGVFTKTKID